MKREYSKPSMNIEVFQANEYIAACKSINAPVTGILYTEGNGKPGYQPWPTKEGLDILIDGNISYTEPICTDNAFIDNRKAKFQVKKDIYDVTYHRHIINGGKEKLHITGYAKNAS